MPSVVNSHTNEICRFLFKGGTLTVRLRTEDAAVPLTGRLLYRRTDRAFAFEPGAENSVAERTGGGGTASLTIDTLQIEVAVRTGVLLYVWGYHPMEGWKEGALRPPVSRPGQLYVEESGALSPGVGLEITDGSRWVTTYDQGAGWVRVRDPDGTSGTEVVEFAVGTIAEMSSGRLVALWLLPQLQ